LFGCWHVGCGGQTHYVTVAFTNSRTIKVGAVLANLANQFNAIIAAVSAHAVLAFEIVLALWVIQIINVCSHYALNRFGLIPRYGPGLIGIVTSPFLHGNFSHLFLNSIPLFALAALVLIQGVHVFIQVTLVIMFIGGLLVWLFGRRAVHVGASGVIMGYWAYLLVMAVHEISIMTVILAIICIYYFGSMVMNIFPTDKESSWEGHLFGAVAGVIAVYII
jgi:membrane associated rhomboid family serine protease